MNNNRTFSITGHMVVKNEDRWIWFSIMSVIDFLDKLIIYDTGSVDHTTHIIEQLLSNPIYSDKILYKKMGKVPAEEFYKIRQEQIEQTNTDYFMVVDGDEIWYKKSLEELEEILQIKPFLVATRFINACGDVFHYRLDSRETYCINGEIGAITIRVYSMDIPGISCSGLYGVEGYVDSEGISVQNQNYFTITQNGKFFHTSLLNRSSAQNGDFSIKYRRAKLKADWDEKFPDQFKFPEVFYINNLPKYVKSPFVRDYNLIRWLYHIFRKGKKVFVK